MTTVAPSILGPAPASSCSLRRLVGGLSGALFLAVAADALGQANIGFQWGSFGVSEESALVELTVVRFGDLNFTVQLNFATTNGTATAGLDYTAVTGTLTFLPQETSKTISIPILNDALIEGTEWFFVGLSNAPPGVVLTQNPWATVYIYDNDWVSLSWNTTTVGEQDGSFGFHMVRSGEITNAETSVMLVTSDGSATAGEDYVGLSNVVVFAVGETDKPGTVTILNDALVEGDEWFSLGLTLNDGTPLPGGTTGVSVTIIDNDRGLEFTQSSYTVNEDGGAVELTLQRRGEALDAGTVRVMTADSSAVGGDDYVIMDQVVTFAAGESNKTFRVLILDDPLAEGDEWFSVGLSDPTDGIVLGQLAVTGVLIRDNEIFGAPGVGFVSPDYYAGEGAGQAMLAVQRYGDSFDPISVDYAGDDGSTGTLTFAPLETLKMIQILVVDDNVAGPDRLLTIELFNATGLALATLHILDDDRPGSLDLGFSATALSFRAPTDVAVQQDGKVLVSGVISLGDGRQTSLARLNTDGSLDTSFDLVIPVQHGWWGGSSTEVFSFALDPEGSVEVGGSFSLVNDLPRMKVARVREDGSVDPGFSPQNPLLAGDVGCCSQVNLVTVQPDGGVIAAGYSFQGWWMLTRLLTNGLSDPGFANPIFDNGGVEVLAVQPDGKVLAGGWFNSVNGVEHGGLVRFNADGTIDDSFDPFASNQIYGSVSALALQSDGRILVGGEFFTVGETPRTRVARLDADGNLDPEFHPGNGPDASVLALGIEPDGTVLLGGYFSAVDIFSAPRLARLLPDGFFDASFDPGSGPDQAVKAIRVEPEGSVVIAGDFNFYNGVPRHGLARLGSGVHGTLPPTLLAFPRPGLAVAEDAGAVMVTVRRYGATNAESTVAYATSNLTATAGLDYTATAGTLTFAPGERAKTIEIPILNDLLVEGDELFVLVLSDPVGAGLPGLQPATLAFVTIVDNDRGPEFSTPAVVVPENAGSVSLVVEHQGESTQEITLDYATQDGEARAGLDYTAQSGTLHFAAGERTKTIRIPILNDSAVEGDESFSIVLTNPSGINRLGARSVARVTILDNDRGPEFSTTEFLVNEDVGTVTLTVEHLGENLGEVTVDYATQDGLALAGYDYVAQSGTLHFAPGETNKTIVIPILNDGAVEPTESFQVLLSHPTGVDVVGPRAAAVVSIQDNDLGPEFVSTIYSVREDERSVVLTVQHLGEALHEVTVDYVTENLQALAGQDYVAKSGTLHFAPGETNKTITITILNDGQVENTELFQVVLRNPTGVDSLGAHPIATVRILDNDPGVGFTGSQYLVAENDAAAVLSVRRLGDTTDALSVNYATRDLEAVAGQDYVGQTGTLTFAPGETSRTISIPLLNDGLVEGVERFLVVLSDPPGTRAVASNGISTAAVAILDNDVAPEFERALVSVSEAAGSVTLSVRRLGEAFNAITVDYATSNLTALAGQDYVAQSGTLEFPAGETNRTITIPILNDGLVEGPETFAVILSHPTGINVLGHNSTATVTILDNDLAPEFEVDKKSVPEDAGSVTMSVRRLGEAFNAITVDYATVDLTATAGLDYVAQSGTLQFAAGETNQTITIPILNDSLVEGPETFAIILSHPTGVNTLGQQSIAVVTILDNDRGPEFAAPTFFVNERAGLATVVVRRIGDATNEAVIADYATRDLEAIAGLDYVAAVGTLHFAPGQREQSFSVHVLDDVESEHDERVLLTLRYAAQGTLPAGSNTAILVIIDDEPVGGRPDPAFAPVVSGPGVNALALLPDGRILIGGEFYQVNGVGRTRLARLHPDGSLDMSFDPGTGPDGTVTALALQTDGAAVAAGYFAFVDGTFQGRTARFLADGALDPEFPSRWFATATLAVALQADGKVLVGGVGNQGGPPGDPSSRGLMRLNPNGSFDTNFFGWIGAIGSVYAIAVQPDGKVILGGSLYAANGVRRNGLARLNVDGSIDNSFAPLLDQAPTMIRGLGLAPDGRIVAACLITAPGGALRNLVKRFYPDGSVDLGFNGGSGANTTINTVAVQRDGRVLMGGYFSSVNGIPRNGFARLNIDGSVDTTLDPGDGADCEVSAILEMPDGSVLIGGCFTYVDGQPHSGVAKLLGGVGTVRLGTPLLLSGTTTRRVGYATSPGYRYVLEASTNLRDWAPLGTNNATDYVSHYDDTRAAAAGQQFYRVLRLTP